MAEGLNKAILIGNLGADPEIRYTQSNTAVCKLRVATNESWVNKAGERQDRTEWHQVVVWGKQGEVTEKYLSKGSQVYIEGRIQTRSWEDRDGNKRYTTEIVANKVLFLSGRTSGSGSRDDAGDHYQEPEGEPFPADDDDIPF